MTTRRAALVAKVVDDAGMAPAAQPGGWASVLRFVIAGAINTLLSILIYQAALFVTGHMVAYGVAYVATIVTAYYAYSRHVFRAAMSKRRFATFAAFYVLSWAAGSLINAALIEHWDWHERLAIFATVVIMLPVNYLGSRWCTGAAGRG